MATLRLKTALLNFYAITGDIAEPTVHKVNLTAPIQSAMSELFIKQQAAFKPENCEIFAWSPDYKPEVDELLVIQTFDLPANIKSLAHSAQALPSLSDDLLESGDVRAIIGVTHEAKPVPSLPGTPPAPPVVSFLFQGIDGRQVLKRTKFSLLVSGDVFSKNDKTGLIARGSLDAIVVGDSLYLKSYIAVRRFLDLTQFFREATDSEVVAFTDHAIFAVDDKAAIVAVSDQWARRKITSIKTSNVLELVKVDKLVAVAKTFGIVLPLRGSGAAARLVLPAGKKELKEFLRFLDQDYLRSELTEDRFRVNSKHKV
jgi:Domain of unknown function (DUF4868)